MRLTKLSLTLFVALFSFSSIAAHGKPSVYDRVMEKESIRCGYFSWYPALLKDPKTGEFKGILYDYVNAIGKALSLKIEWAEEVGLGDVPAALGSGRIDAMCSGIFPSSERARVMDFVEPPYYIPMFAFSRKGDARFEKDLTVLNDKKYKIAVLEGGITSIIRRQYFPEAQALELSHLNSPAELFVSLAQGKADAVIFDATTFYDFDGHNPGKVQFANPNQVKVYPMAVGISRGQEDFRRMLDNATRDLFLSGGLNAIIARYEKYPGTLLRPAKPYEAAK
jgi:ABC-type amino acid transport substrate-binding protein